MSKNTFRAGNKKSYNETHKGTTMEQFSDMIHQIYINSQKKFWNNKTIRYEQLCDLAFSKFIKAATIQYSHGPPHCIQGTLMESQSIDIQDGMVFDVTITNNA